MAPEKVIIAGAGGRDFHNFNVYFRGNPDYEVVAFTATQIPNIADRRYPPELSGDRYPEGIPIYDETELGKLIAEFGVDEVIFAYSDVSNQYVMDFAARVMAAGADFRLMGPAATMVKAQVPVISICAVRTGCGKSQTTRRIASLLRKAGKKVIAIRHPMPYGDLRKQQVQRFVTLEDLDRYECTIEEREEYEPHIVEGVVVYAGCDYEAIVREAEKEAEIILWDGGNNDFSFFQSDLEIVVADPHRVGHELTYYPGTMNVRRAHVVVINKVETADRENIDTLRANIGSVNPSALIVEAASPIAVDDSEAIKGKRVLVVEDGPTLTHGEMSFGAGTIAAKKFGAAQTVDPREFAVGEIRDVFDKYPHVSGLLPAVGYGEEQIRDLEETVNRIDCDLVIVGTPIDLRRLLKLNKPAVLVTYDLEERTKPDLADILADRGFLK